MKKNHFKVIIIALVFLTGKIFSQAIVRDNWDTLHANVTYTYPGNTTYFQQNGNLVLNNKLVMFGDSVNQNTSNYSSYIKSFDPSNNSVTSYNFVRTVSDFGLSSAAARVTNTPNVSFAFFGAKYYSEYTANELAIYKLNSNTNVVSSETISVPLANYIGVSSMCFFSPGSNHDSLIIFFTNDNGTVQVFKKHYAQNGIINSNITLPFNFDISSKSIVYNNTLYLKGYSNGNPLLVSSSDGLNFAINNNFNITYPDYNIQDMDTMNNELYLGIYDYTNDDYKIVKTSNGLTYNDVYVTPVPGQIQSLINYKKRIWSLKINPTLYLGSYKPIINYVGGQMMDTEILSIDTIGRYYNSGYTFAMNKINNKLYLSGNLIDNTNNVYGTFVYRLKEPVANYSISTTQLCLNMPYTVFDNSTNADSVRWFKDNLFAAGNQTIFPFSFNPVGQHTLGLIAINGTQKDTMRITVNAYSVTVNTSGALVGCANNSITISSNITNTVGACTYSWSIFPTPATSSPTLQNITITSSVANTFSYGLQVTDGQNCQSSSSLATITINASKDISGVVTNSGTPVAGNVIIYKYEPVLTKFDSVTYQTTDALGNYNFSAINSSSYILMCVPTASNLQTTYANGSISWKGATVLNHGCVTNTVQNINVVALTNLGTGPGVLSGKVLEGLKFGQKSALVSPGGPVKGIQVKCGRNPGGDAIAQTTTNPLGEYSFSNLPANAPGQSFFILVDIPGLDTNGTYHKIITLGNPTFTDLDFVADSAKINPGIFIGVKEILTKNASYKIYPNPTNGIINFEGELLLPTEIQVSITDVLGKEIFNTSPKIAERKFEINLTGMKSGVYFFNINIGGEITRTKIILTN
jgi:hypothetical protein